MSIIIKRPERYLFMLAQGLLHASRTVLVFLVMSASLANEAATAAGVCANLPPSKLQIYDAKPRQLEVRAVPAEQLDQEIPTDVPFSRHTMMLTTNDTVAWFDIDHRIIARGDGSVCDSPTLVRMGIGSSKRVAFLADIAAEDDCIRQYMLDHEAVHARVYEEALSRFIDERQNDLQRGMSALKQMSAPSSDVAKAQWEEGLRMILVEAKRQFMVDVQLANQHVDDAATLAALGNACGGKIRELEQKGGMFP